MKITKADNPSLVKSLKERRKCEWGGVFCGGNLDMAHVIGENAGGQFVRCGIVVLCRLHHSASHNANSENGVRPNTNDLLRIAAKRCGVGQQTVIDTIWFIANQLDKDDSTERIGEKIEAGELSDETKLLVRKSLRECGILPE